jgi:tetratricopeptide (TPR) repeat protein
MGLQLDRSSRADALQERVDRLARQYPYASAADLLTKVNRLRRLIGGLSDSARSAHSARRRDLAAANGWATLLAACLEHDLGRPARATALTGEVSRLGAEADHSHLVAWSQEIRGWQAVTAGRYPDAVRICRDAFELAPRSHVGVQLKVQEAKALARMGRSAMALVALADAEQVLGRAPATAQPEHHFAFDRSKWLFYAAQVFDLAGDSAATAVYTQECYGYCVAPDGSTRWPMRVAELELGLAHLHARAGSLDAAVGYGLQALDHVRQSGPSLLQRAIDLDAALSARWAGESRTRQFHSALRRLQTRYATLAPSVAG